MSETAVERRLREMLEYNAHFPTIDPEYAAAIDVGREAIALLRLLIPGVAIGDVCLSTACPCEYCHCGTLRAVHEAQAPLARCEGDQ